MQDAGAHDELARSQLALLYKLGLLQQDPGEENEDPHAFLNRLPPPSSPDPLRFEMPSGRDSQSSGDRAHESATKPLTHSMLASHTQVRPFTATSKIHAAWPHRPSILDDTQRPKSSLPAREGDVHRFTRAHQSSVVVGDVEAEKERWFMQWKRRVQKKWKVADAEVRGRRLIKQRTIRRWQSAVYQTRLHDSKAHMMMRWKARQSIAVWSHLAVVRSRIRWMLTSRGRSETLLIRLRKQRTWHRWKRFAVWSRLQRSMNEKSVLRFRRNLVRRCWLEWRVQVFHQRRHRHIYRVFMAAVRRYQREAQSRQATADSMRIQCNRRRCHEVFRRWWSFVVGRQRDHIRVWRIRMIMTRGKFFTLWQSAAVHSRRIHALRFYVRGRILRDTLRAWNLATQAAALGRQSTLWHPEAIKARYLDVWKQQTAEAIHHRTATEAIDGLRKRRAVQALRAWALDHGKYARRLRAADTLARRMVLLRVWTNGLVPFHFLCKQEKEAVKKVKVMVLGKPFRVWGALWSQKNAWRQKKQTARRLAWIGPLRSAWQVWYRYLRGRREHKRGLAIASHHYLQRLQLLGLMAFSHTVSRKSLHTTAARQIRIRHRHLLKLRVFTAMKDRILQQRQLASKTSTLLSRPWFAGSIYNPVRRRWIQWCTYVRRQRDLRVVLQGRGIRRKRLILIAWRRTARAMATAAAFASTQQLRQVHRVFQVWVDRTEAWVATAIARAEASHFHRYKVLHRFFSAWKTLVHVKMKRLHRLSEMVRVTHDRAIFTIHFYHLRRRFYCRQGIAALVARRRILWLSVCWGAWLSMHFHASRQKRELLVFHQKNGRWPSTSPLFRVWMRWRSWSQCRRCVKQSHLQRQSRLIRVCFDAWSLRSFAKRVLAAWHTASVSASAMNGDLGKRRRVFRQRQNLRRLVAVFTVWIMARRSSQAQRERLAHARSCLPTDLHAAYCSRVKLRRHQLRQWLQRWRRRQQRTLYGAAAYHRRHVLRRVFITWWRTVVHSKQERVLQQARQTMGTLSVFKMASKGPMSPQGGRTSRQADKHQVKTMMPRTVASYRAGTMVDPLAPSLSYSHPYRTGSSVESPVVYRGTMRRSEDESSRRSSRNDEQTTTLLRSQSLRDPRVLKPRHHESDRTVHQARASEGGPAARDEIPRRTARSSGSDQELPLWDSEIGWTEEKAQSATTVKKLPPSRQIASQRQERQQQPADDAAVLSLESLASMDLYSPTKSETRFQQHDQTMELLLPPPPPHKPPVEQLPPKRLPRIAATTKATKVNPTQVNTANSPLAPRRHTEPSLAELLDVSSSSPPAIGSVFRHVLDDMVATQDQTVDARQIVDVIVGYYVAKAHDHSTAAWLETWGFCMLRDLGLLDDHAFVATFHRVCEAASGSGGDPSNTMRLLLDRFIEGLAVFKAASARDPTSWLVHTHMTRRLGKNALLSRGDGATQRAFWIRHALPIEVILAMDKLTKCIRKYRKQIDYFFRWRPAAGASHSDWMDSSTFIHLMKHCNVHPQLFDRRELEAAVECAGSRNRTASTEVTMNLPEFVEALIRCSLRLQWGPDQGSTASLPDEKVVVVKFVMLVLVMEGQGTMLAKRGDDVDVVLDLLRRHQDQQKTDKLRRFQGLLRDEALSARPTRSARQVLPSNTFRTAMAVVSDEPSTALDGRQPRYDQPTSKAKAAEESYARRTGPSISESLRSQQGTGDVPAVDLSTGVIDHTARSVTATRDYETQWYASGDADTRGGTDDHDEQQSTPGLNLRPPMDRDAFLSDILSTINDVELLLLHSEPRQPFQLSDDSDTSGLSSEPFSIAHPERYAVLMGGELPPVYDDNVDVVIDDISVHDPLLDHLTFADRFTESADWRTELTIMDLQENGIHAASPAARYVTNPLESTELEDLTAPLPAQAYLRSLSETMG